MQKWDSQNLGSKFFCSNEVLCIKKYFNRFFPSWKLSAIRFKKYNWSTQLSFETFPVSSSLNTVQKRKLIHDNCKKMYRIPVKIGIVRYFRICLFRLVFCKISRVWHEIYNWIRLQDNIWINIKAIRQNSFHTLRIVCNF